MTGVSVVLGAIFLACAFVAFMETFLDVWPYRVYLGVRDGIKNPGTANWTTWPVFATGVVLTATGWTLLS